MHYNRFRYYDPGIGRYINADPIGQAGGANVFRYAESNPMVRVDPRGLNSIAEFAINTNQGLAAFADGFIPFADPFADAGFYDPCDPTLKGSKTAGEATLGAEAALLAYGLVYGFGPLGGVAAAEGAAAGGESATGLEKQLAAHEQRLRDYLSDPDSHDDKGFLSDPRNEDRRDDIIEGRRRNLEGQIDNFRRQIDSARRGK